MLEIDHPLASTATSSQHDHCERTTPCPASGLCLPVPPSLRLGVPQGQSASVFFGGSKLKRKSTVRGPHFPASETLFDMVVKGDRKSRRKQKKDTAEIECDIPSCLETPIAVFRQLAAWTAGLSNDSPLGSWERWDLTSGPAERIQSWP